MLSLELPDVCELAVVNVNAKRMSAFWGMSRYENWIVLIVVQYVKKGTVMPLSRQDK
jgi:hypothetical protein